MTDKKAERMYAITGELRDRVIGSLSESKHANLAVRLMEEARPLTCNIMTCPNATDMCMERNGAQGQQETLAKLIERIEFVVSARSWIVMDTFVSDLKKQSTIQQGKQAQPQDATIAGMIKSQGIIGVLVPCLGDCYDDVKKTHCPMYDPERKGPCMSHVPINEIKFEYSDGLIKTQDAAMIAALRGSGWK